MTRFSKTRENHKKNETQVKGIQDKNSVAYFWWLIQIKNYATLFLSWMPFSNTRQNYKKMEHKKQNKAKKNKLKHLEYKMYQEAIHTRMQIAKWNWTKGKHKMGNENQSENKYKQHMEANWKKSASICKQVQTKSKTGAN